MSQYVQIHNISHCFVTPLFWLKIIFFRVYAFLMSHLRYPSCSAVFHKLAVRPRGLLTLSLMEKIHHG